ncbi:ABC transporter permease [Sanguibacter suaedae]|uniref:FtsX-like permease family protein n=1 Tax=Sanguibacter suaedae TaxID=2795737 RepID=A0A934MDU8_9MICO|nr:FtsX-like permease family protein [Sanguibacter suaedae]MBI9115124.1 FtsX-like permease family protein [Sanguibacter suaedae]
MSARTAALILSVRDVVEDVVVEIHARRARTVLLLAAVALSTGALISSLGISAVAARQVDAGLAASTIDLVTVQSAARTATPADDTGSTDAEEPAARLLPDDAQERATALDLVAAAGTRLDLTELRTMPVSRHQPGTPGGETVTGVTVSGISSGYLDTIRTDSTPPASFLLDEPERIVLLGETAAKTLGIPVSATPLGLTLWLDGYRYTVVGFISSSTVDLSSTIAIPYPTAVALAGSDRTARVLVRTAPGAGAPVVDAIRTALRPDAPERLTSSQVSGVADLRAGVSTQLDRYAAGIGAFLLLITTLLIANSMIVSVTSRTAEIGVRRAMGAGAGNVAALVLTEGGLVGLLGGLAGSALAAVAIVVVGLVNDWTVLISASSLVAGPALGALAGVVSSLYPAVRAARIQPALAVRSD